MNMKAHFNPPIREDIFHCPCCDTLRDNNHRKISRKYCMGCREMGKKNTKKISKNGLYGQFCDSCYVQIKKMYGL